MLNPIKDWQKLVASALIRYELTLRIDLANVQLMVESSEEHHYSNKHVSKNRTRREPIDDDTHISQ